MADTEESPKPKKKKPGRKKGTKKTGGRKKGTPNKNSLNVLSALDRANLPLVELLVMAISEIDNPEIRSNQFFRLMNHCYPQLKAIDHNPQAPQHNAADPGDAPAPATPEERMRLIRGKFPRQPGASG